MKKKLKLVIAIVLSVVAIGCSNNTPSGTDKNVKGLVIEIATEEFRDQLTAMYYKEVNPFAAYTGTKMTYAFLLKNSSSNNNYKKVLKTVDELMVKCTFTLKNIRVDKVDDNINKSWSSADLFVNDTKRSITYTAQINSDGELYVEVFGLK